MVSSVYSTMKCNQKIKQNMKMIKHISWRAASQARVQFHVRQAWLLTEPADYAEKDHLPSYAKLKLSLRQPSVNEVVLCSVTVVIV